MRYPTLTPLILTAGLAGVLGASACDDARPPVPTQLTTPRPDLSGHWHVTIEAASDCAALLAEAGRTRSFEASVVQTGFGLSVTLSSQSLQIPARFEGRIWSDHVAMVLAGSAYYYYRYTPPTILDVLDQFRDRRSGRSGHCQRGAQSS